MMKLALMRTATEKAKSYLCWSSLELTAPQIPAQINASHSSSNRHILTLTVQRRLCESGLHGQIAVPLQQFDHKGLIHTVSSEQLMLRCFCYLNIVKHLFGLQFLRLVTLMNLSSAAEVTLSLPFMWLSS